MTAKDRSELDWLAFQYVAGELPADEAARFEERLAVDQQACEAVADAVELAEVTCTVIERPVVELSAAKQPRLDWARSVAWMGCGAAACLMFVALVQPANRNLRPSNHEPVANSGSANSGSASSGSASGESRELALAWAMARTNTPAVTVDDVSEIGAVEISDVSGQEEKRSEDDVISTPSWMLAGVAGLGVSVEEIE
jgi:hypothetical protein